LCEAKKKKKVPGNIYENILKLEEPLTLVLHPPHWSYCGGDATGGMETDPERRLQLAKLGFIQIN
jgi:hypothetical protein